MHFDRSLLPSGFGAIGHDIITPTLHDNVFEQVLAPINLDLAWQRVKANKGSAGVDVMSIDNFPKYAQAKLGRHQSATHQQDISSSTRIKSRNTQTRWWKTLAGYTNDH